MVSKKESVVAVVQPPIETFLEHFKTIDVSGKMVEYDIEDDKKTASGKRDTKKKRSKRASVFSNIGGSKKEAEYDIEDAKKPASSSLEQNVHSLPTPAELTGKRDETKSFDKRARVFSLPTIIMLSVVFCLMIVGIAAAVVTAVVRTIDEQETASMFVYGDDDEAIDSSFTGRYNQPKIVTPKGYAYGDDDLGIAPLPGGSNTSNGQDSVAVTKAVGDDFYTYGDDDGAIASVHKEGTKGRVKETTRYTYGDDDIGVNDVNDNDGSDLDDYDDVDADADKSYDDENEVKLQLVGNSTLQQLVDDDGSDLDDDDDDDLDDDDDGYVSNKFTDKPGSVAVNKAVDYTYGDDDGAVASVHENDTKGEVKETTGYTYGDDDMAVNDVKVNDGNDYVSDAVNERPIGKVIADIALQQLIFQSDIVKYLLVRGVSSENDLMNPSSGQFRAVEWLISIDQSVVLPNDKSSFLIERAFIMRYTMAVMYFATNGDRWLNKLNFLEPSSHVCDWFGIITAQESPDGYFNSVPRGVACDEDDFIEGIFLDENNLFGTIPPELGRLPSLRAINFDNNNIYSIIPDSISKSTGLQHISIAHNHLTGTLPTNIHSMASLETIDLSNNYITGTIPVGSSSMLNSLALDNNFLKGSIRQVFEGNLTPKIEFLYLGANEFTETIDDFFLTGLVYLKSLDISDTGIDGTLPDHFFTMPNLKILDLSNNEIEGTLPSTISANKDLFALSLHHNNLYGQIPDSIGDNFNALYHLDLSSNDFTGSIPDSIGYLSNLKYLFLAENPFDIGPIPGFLKHLKNLGDLSLKGTSRSGTIPDFIGEELTNLVLLDLDQNALVGSIPASIGNLKQLQLLILNENRLTGTLPSEIGDLGVLRMLYIDDNFVTGSLNEMFCDRPAPEDIPSIVADCENPEELDEFGTVKIECTCCFKCCSQMNPCSDHNLLLHKDPTMSSGSFSSFEDRSNFFAFNPV